MSIFHLNSFILVLKKKWQEKPWLIISLKKKKKTSQKVSNYLSKFFERFKSF